ncbi:MAG: MarR family transcriptional regulator [Acidimicrobiales bacterium]
MAKWLDDEEMKAWRGLVDVFADVEASLGAELVDHHGISSGDYAVLVALSEAEGHRRRMCDLASVLHLSPSGLTRRLDGLVKKGFVAREPLADDRRVTMAALTNRGMAKLERAAPLHVDGVRRHLLDHLTRTQIRQLGAVLSTVQRRRHEAMADE